MEPNKPYENLNQNSQPSQPNDNNGGGIFTLISKNKLLIIPIVVVLVVFFTVVYLNSTTPGGFSPLRALQQNSTENVNNLPEPQAAQRHLGVVGSYNKKTKEFVLFRADIKDGAYEKNPKADNLGYRPTDLNTLTQLKVGIVYDKGTKNEGYYVDSGPADLVEFNLRFPAEDQFTLYIEDAKLNVLAQKLVRVN